jgi:hypothetical protein
MVEYLLFIGFWYLLRTLYLMDIKIKCEMSIKLVSNNYLKIAINYYQSFSRFLFNLKDQTLKIIYNKLKHFNE